MRVRAAASQSHPADRGAGQRGPQPTRGRSAESVPGVSGGRGGRARSGSSYSDVRCSVPSGPRVHWPAPWEPARSQDRWSVDAPPSGPFPGAPGHSPPPAGGDPTHRSSRRARGGPPPRTPRSGTGAAGRTPSPVDAGRTREGSPTRGPARTPSCGPLKRSPRLPARVWGPAVARPAPEPVEGAGDMRAAAGSDGRICTRLPADPGRPARTGSAPTAWSRGHAPAGAAAPPDPDRGRLRAWPGSMINRRLWGPDRAQSA